MYRSNNSAKKITILNSYYLKDDNALSMYIDYLHVDAVAIEYRNCTRYLFMRFCVILPLKVKHDRAFLNPREL